jgi:hypothetical protein
MPWLKSHLDEAGLGSEDAASSTAETVPQQALTPAGNALPGQLIPGLRIDLKTILLVLAAAGLTYILLRQRRGRRKS